MAGRMLSDLVFGFEACFELLEFSPVAGRSGGQAFGASYEVGRAVGREKGVRNPFYNGPNCQIKVPDTFFPRLIFSVARSIFHTSLKQCMLTNLNRQVATA
jgi:hypothetical protein